MEKYVVEHKIRIGPSPFRAVRYLKDARYLPGDTALETERLNKTKRETCAFFACRFPSFAKKFSSFRFRIIQTLPNIALGAEMLVHFGNNYEFRGWRRSQ